MGKMLLISVHEFPLCFPLLSLSGFTKATDVSKLATATPQRGDKEELKLYTLDVSRALRVMESH